MRALILSAILILFVSGCSLNRVSPIETETVAVERTPLNLPPADHLDLSDPRWVVVTPDNVDEVFERITDEGHSAVIIGLTSDGYENLSIDFAKIREHINTQRNVLLQYKQYYEDAPDTPPVSSE